MNENGPKIDLSTLDRVGTDELRKHVPIVLAVLRANLKKRGLVASGELLSSLAAQVYEDTSKHESDLEMLFAGQGRYVEMRQSMYEYPPPLKPILAWVKKKGLMKFSFAPGYVARMPVDQDKALLRVAEALRRGIAKRRDKRAEKWWSSAFYKSINTVVGRIVSRYAEETGVWLGREITP